MGKPTTEARHVFQARRRLPIEVQALFVVPQVGKTGEAGDRFAIPPRSLDVKMPDQPAKRGGFATDYWWL